MNTYLIIKFIKLILRPFYNLLRRLPFFNFIIQRIYSSIRFRNEILLLKGRHKNSNNHQSIVFFTVHRCASGYVGGILKELATEAGMTAINFAFYYYRGGKTKKSVYKINGLGKAVYKRLGYFYGPFRAFNPGILNIDDYKIILMLRDPRDVLTSNYFAKAYSHEIPYKQNPKLAKRIHSRREEMLKMTIDEYVLYAAQGFFKRYTTCCQRLLNKPNVLFVKYEDMVNDFKRWLDTIITFLDLDVREKVVDKIISEADFNVEKEDIFRHKRQVTPGDHKRKLKSETISILNSQFQEILNLLDYPWN